MVTILQLLVSAMTSIFEYLDYRQYLKDWFQKTKQENSHFSLRSLAKSVGLSAHSFLLLVMQGKRKLTPETARKIARGIRLSTEESQYLELLVRLMHEPEEKSRSHLLEQVSHYQELARAKLLHQDEIEYYKQWYHVAIREMITHSDFQEDSKWIANQLYPKIQEEQAAQALQLLIRLGLVERGENGKLRQTHKVLSTGAEVNHLSEVVRHFHRSVMDLAKGSMEVIPEHIRDISSVTLSVPQKLMPHLKEEIDRFRRRIVRISAQAPEVDTVVQLNLQLFPLTNGWKR